MPLCPLRSTDYRFDSQPDRIVGRVGRRDEFNESGWLWFSIDSRHDHQTGFGFAVNPAGVKVDTVHFKDTQDDRSWDGVWDCETSVDGKGWYAECRIPLSLLRFSTAKVQVWGFQFGRTIQRKRESDWWVLRPRGTSGYVSRFGHMRGLTVLQTPHKIEILPYVVARSDRLAGAPPSDQEIRTATGLDMKYGVTVGSTIEATFNPDFAQVEADPAVLNLTVYETFYPERRPFFIEAANFFKTPLLLFHSGRIGRAGPGRPPLPAGDVLLDSPDATTIAAAAKWTGKSPHGLAFGVLGTLTTREFAHVLDAINRPRLRLIEPATAHGVVRVTQDFAHGNAYFGGIATAVERGSGDADVYTGGVDWDWRSHQNVYQFPGQLIASRIRSATATPPAAGWGGYWDFRKRGGRHVQCGLSGKALDARLDFNGLGFLRRNNQLDLEGRIAYLLPDPNRITRSAEYALEINRPSRLTDGLKLGASYSFIASQQFLNYYWLGLGAGFAERSFDDLDTRGGPPIVKPRSFSQWLWFGSDSRNALTITLTTYRSTNQGGGNWHSSYLAIQVKPSANISFSLHPSYSFNRNVA